MSAKLYELCEQRDFKTLNPQTQFLIWAVTERKEEFKKENRLSPTEVFHLECLAKNLRRSPSIIEAGEKLLANQSIGWSWQSWLQIILSDCLHPFHSESYHHSIRISQIVLAVKEKCAKSGFAGFSDFGNREFAKLQANLIFSQEDWECIENAAFYHDLGKLGFPAGFWDTPGEFTKEQRESRKVHPPLFFPMGEKFSVPLKVTGLALAHHYLNLGYPKNGLIKIFQNYLLDQKFRQMLEILTTLDVYDGMRGRRCYRRAVFSHEQVKARMPRELGLMGLRFTPLLEVVPQTPRIEKLYPAQFG